MRKALCIGINDYPNFPLKGCINDAKEISRLLSKNFDGTVNFDVRIEYDTPSKGKLMGFIKELFSGDPEIALLYYSGHGTVDEIGGYLVTPDYSEHDVGINMDDILILANNSKAQNRVIILDCCNSGKIGTPEITDEAAHIKEGVTILTASKKDESAVEKNRHGVFTNLLLDALEGGAADIKGDITPGSVYAYIDQALGAWDQRPVFKTNITRFISLRKFKASVELIVLRKLAEYFPDADKDFNLDPSYEYTNSPDIEHEVIQPHANPENVEIFKNLQKFTSVNLVKPVDTEHMYFAAMESKSCSLTPLGYHYWRLIKEKRI